MTRSWKHEVKGEYDIAMDSVDRDLNSTDIEFAESIVETATLVFDKAKNHLLSLLNLQRVEFSEPPFLNRIEISPGLGSTYRVRVELHFPNDNEANWWVLFNVPYPFPPFPYGKERTYWPIELGQTIE